MHTKSFQNKHPYVIVAILWITAIIAPNLGHSQSSIIANIEQSPTKTSVSSNQPDHTPETLPEDYEYPELLTEGKSWVIWHGDAYTKQEGNHITSDYMFYISVDGEETIDGISCKRLKVETEHLGGKCPSCHYGNLKTETKYFYGYEKDRKIYFYRNPGYYYYKVFVEEWNSFVSKVGEKEPYFDIYMDLNINSGDNITDLGIIDKVEYEYIGGKKRRKISSEWQDMPYLNFERNWIEGIGSNCIAAQWDVFNMSLITGASPLLNIGTNETLFRHYGDTLMVMCCENGVPIYDNRTTLESYGIDLSTLSGELSRVQEIQSSQVSRIEDSKIYNLQGIEVSSPQKGQIYIRNGKKILY